ncbi:hypothetical protein PHSC3_000278 [Chlamydiales bacterium STE3]|nr:hypothetical protein PHSC3_000278 [Chlamydiales bacterium STE3]
MPITKVNNRQNDCNVNTLVETNSAQQVKAQPVWAVPDVVSKYTDTSHSFIAQKAPFPIAQAPGLNAKPYLAPPSKDLEEKAAQAVQHFTQFALIPAPLNRQVRKEEHSTDEHNELTEEELIAREEELASFHRELRLAGQVPDGAAISTYESDDDNYITSTTLRKKLFHKQVNKKESSTDLLAKISEQESNAKDDLAKEDEKEELEAKELRKKTFNPDRSVLEAISEQRALYNAHSTLGFGEIKFAQQFSHNLNKEIESLHETLQKRSKTSKVLNWIGAGANIGAGASSIVIAAIALATGGIGALLGIIPVAMGAVGTATKFGAGVASLQHQSTQAEMTERQESRALVYSKVHDLLSESQKANKTLHTLWKTSSDIVKNMAKANSYN